MSLEAQQHGENLLRTSREVTALWFDVSTGRVTMDPDRRAAPGDHRARQPTGG